MSPEQKTLVQTSFAKVVPIADTAASLFYRRLFELDPTLRSLFKGDLTEQGRKLMRMIGMAVTGLDRPVELLPIVRQLGVRHVQYGVKDAQPPPAAPLHGALHDFQATTPPDSRAALTPRPRHRPALSFDRLHDCHEHAGRAGGEATCADIRGA